MPALLRQQGLNMYSKVLLRLLLREYMSKWLTMSILAKSDALEEQRFKAYFEVNIFDKEKADEFVKIFGKWTEDRASLAAVSSVEEKWETSDHLKLQMELERLTREEGKDLRDKSEMELIVKLR